MNLNSQSELARVEEARQARSVADVSDAVLEVAGGLACWAEGAHWACAAFGCGLHGAVPEAEVEQLLHFYRSRGTPARVELAPTADPAFVRSLGVAGLRLIDFDNVLYRTLAQIQPAFPPAGIRLAIVARDDGPAQEAWIDAVAPAFESRALGPGERDVWRRALRHPRCQVVAAMAGDEVVGGGVVEVLGVAGSLYLGAVVPAWRRRGVQTALLAERLKLASLGGAQVAFIDSRPGVATERNAARAGFRLAYTKVLLQEG